MFTLGPSKVMAAFEKPLFSTSAHVKDIKEKPQYQNE